MSKLNEKELYGLMLLENGFTVDTDLNTVENEGYFVSISGIPSSFSMTIMNFELFKSIINQYRFYSQKGQLIGCWIDKDNICYIENSVIVEDLATAINLALAHNQVAIFDNTNKETIYIIDSIEQSNKYEIIV